MNILSQIKHVINGIDIDSLYSRIADLESDLRRIKEDYAIKDKEIILLESKAETLNEDLTRQQNKVSIAENRQRELAIKLSESEKKIISLESQNSTLSESQKSLSEDNVFLKAKITSEQRELAIKLFKLEEKITSLKSQNRTLSESRQSLSKDNISLKAKITRRDNKISSLQEDKDQLSETITKQQEELSILVQKNEELKKAIKESETVNKNNVAEIGRLNTIIVIKNDELEKEKEEKKSVTQKFDEINILFSKLQKNTLEEKDALLNRISESDNRCKKLEEDNATLCAINSNQRDKISLYESEKKARDEKITNLEKENSDISAKLKQAENNISKLMINTKTLQESERSYISKVEKLESQLKEAQDKIIELSSKEITPITIDKTNGKDDASEEDNPDRSVEVIESVEENHEGISTIPDDSEDDEAVSEGNNPDNSAEVTEGDEENRDDISKIPDDSEDEEDVLKDASLPFVFDCNLIPAGKLSIPEVYDIKEGKIINSRDFFCQNENELILWRRSLQEEYLMGHARFICPECKQPVKISGHRLFRGKVCYFTHFKDSDDCPYKTGTNRTKEEIVCQKYSLVQESERHKRLKTVIASALQGDKSRAMGVENVECEKRINSDIPYLKWRRPDVYAEYNGRKYVFELQLSTTFVSVIVDRDIFYRLNDYNIIWIFNFEDNEEYVNLYNLMCMDIYYANKRNVFIFDADAEEKSKEKGELVLKCRWLDENGIWSPDKYVTLGMLQYDEEHNKPFIFDADKAYLEKYPQYVERRKQLEHSREDLLKALMERQKHEEDLVQRRDEERANLQLELLKTNKCVERFRKGTKYGYQYEGSIILPAKYTSAEAIGENGYAQVGVNRKIGLVRKDGKEIVPVAYINIDVINHQHGIIMAKSKQIHLWLGEEQFTLISEFDDKKQTIIKEEDNGKINYILKTETYNYSYSQSCYGNHPICHKNFNGYSKSTLFTFVEDKEYCIIWINGMSYLLSRNCLSSVQRSCSKIISIGIDQLFIAKDYKTELWGVIDLQGNIITEFRYAELIPTESEYLIAKYATDSIAYGVIDYQGREFIEPQYESLIYLNSERFAFRKDNLWGICDRTGNVLHDAEYTYIRGFEYGALRASTLNFYLTKWKVQDNIPSYHDDNVKLCLLNDIGEIFFTEQKIGQYHIRRSGDLYSILSIDNKEIVNYCLSFVEFITESIAIIKDTEGNSGFFIDEKCMILSACKNIEQLAESIFKFENIDGIVAVGDYYGPISDYIFCDIKAIDSYHFIASLKNQWGDFPSHNYVIIDRTGKYISAIFSSIDDFKDGYANAIFQGRKGVIDVAGNMQEKIIKEYEGYTLCEKFENFYFRNKDNEIVSEEFKKVDFLIDMFFTVMKRGETNVRLFSLEVKKATPNSYSNISHLIGNLFVAQNPISLYNYSNSYIYHLYNGIEKIYSSYSPVVVLDNGYIALPESNLNGYGVQKKWKLAKANGTILNDREYDYIHESNENLFRVSINGYEGLVDLNGNPIIEKTICENSYVITHCFADYGLEDPKGNVIFSFDDHISNIVITEDSVWIVCKDSRYALYSIDGNQITEYKFSSITFETTNRYVVIENNVEGHIDSYGKYVESSAESIPNSEVSIFVIMGKYGLRYSNGDIIIPPEYTSIKFLKENLLAVNRGSHVALFDIEGNVLTDFKYSEICCSEDGYIQATRNKTTGNLDNQGREIANILKFNGGYLQSSFGDYSVLSENEDIIIPVGYSSIDLLDNDGIFALWNGTKVAISNTSKDKTGAIYESAKSIGNGFIVVSRTICKKTRIPHTGYGYRGNPYTYYSTHIVKEKKYGIIDYQLRTIIACKYASISDFDTENNLTVVNSHGDKKTISLHNLKKKASHTIELSIDLEYEAKVQSFMAIGIIIKIQGNSFVIHKKYLFKDKNDFKKGEIIVAKFLGYDKDGHAIWSTKGS